ncbi:calcium/calmodulin-dependent protein kinase type II-like [Actinia tenebrosa]|uniref:Calcium/calmodulin-dependent protein kinase type II-like n=1 Tax=Actinia tenebrosa TaxID=6105 RepID=A0A6P8I542_ACTTE|nr:calcium/calmodulin-dependent protein kinase type II-like [Actinia tenebrosa]
MEFLCQFEVRDILGKGSFSEVKRCIDKRTKTDYAVKELPYRNKKEKSKITNEVEILQKLDHHNIIRLHYMYAGQQSYYLVLEHASGGDLLNDIVCRSMFSEQTAREISVQILDAVQYLHDKHVVHRNIRPEKFVLAWKSVSDQPFPPIKLTGFGIARRLTDEWDTVRCQVEGSPLYLAPETVTDQPIGTPVDIWACGVILYILLAGYPPFWSTQRPQLFKLITNGQIRFPQAELKGISPEAMSRLSKMLNVEPKERITADQSKKETWIVCEKWPFNAKRKLKGAVLTVFAMNRMQESGSS